MRYLTKEQIIRLNRDTVREHGGNFIQPHNFLHEERLDYLLDAVQATLFGEPMYPSIADKAAVYCIRLSAITSFLTATNELALVRRSTFCWLMTGK